MIIRSLNDILKEIKKKLFLSTSLFYKSCISHSERIYEVIDFYCETLFGSLKMFKNYNLT